MIAEQQMTDCGRGQQVTDRQTTGNVRLLCNQVQVGRHRVLSKEQSQEGQINNLQTGQVQTEDKRVVRVQARFGKGVWQISIRYRQNQY